MSVTLGELERAVLDCLWQADGAATVREVQQALQPERRLAHTTVMTTLQRLARKGLVEQDARERAHRFRAIASRQELFDELLSDALGIANEDPTMLVRFLERLEPEAHDALSEAFGGNSPRRARRLRGKD